MDKALKNINHGAKKSVTHVRITVGEETKEMFSPFGRSKAIENLASYLGLSSIDKYDLSKQGSIEYFNEGKLHKIEILETKSIDKESTDIEKQNEFYKETAVDQ